MTSNSNVARIGIVEMAATVGLTENRMYWKSCTGNVVDGPRASSTETTNSSKDSEKAMMPRANTRLVRRR